MPKAAKLTRAQEAAAAKLLAAKPPADQENSPSASPKQAPKPNARGRKKAGALKDVTNATGDMEALLLKIQELEAEKETALADKNAALAKAAAAVAARPAKPPTVKKPASDFAPDDSIRKPKGTAGNGPKSNGYTLIDEMGISRATMKEILITMHRAVGQAGLDCRVKWVHQPSNSLTRIFVALRNAHPELCQYRNNWASADIIKQYLHNQRTWENKQISLGKRAPRREAGAAQDEEEGVVAVQG